MGLWCGCGAYNPSKNLPRKFRGGKRTAGRSNPLLTTASVTSVDLLKTKSPTGVSLVTLHLIGVWLGTLNCTVLFTGIIETLGTLTRIEREGTNIHFTIASALSKELKVDQSLAHDGVCLTVTRQDEHSHTVTAIQETLDRTRVGEWTEGTLVNLERAMQQNGRLDGHIVQGHVDKTGTCTDVREVDGSWYFTFRYELAPEHLLVDKGSVCINGVSLTVVEPVEDTFKVAIIPYTYEHTNFKQLQPGSTVNLEFDILGKYIAKYPRIYGAGTNAN